VKALAKYTVEHFRTEEALMEKLNYPEMAVHKAAHEELLTKVTDLIAGVESGKVTLPLTLGRFLADWISHHIRGNDLQMIRWVRAQTGFAG
jgi:hemerythrin-like metal-binding protein